MADCLILSAAARRLATEIEAGAPERLSLTVCDSVEAALERYSGETMLFGEPDLAAAVIDRLPDIEWVQSTWAGIAPMLKVQRRDFVLTGVKGVFGPQMAEYVLGYLLAYELKIIERRESQQQKIWNPSRSGMLAGKRMLLLGTGSIGSHIGGAAAALGVHVVGVNRSGACPAGFQRIVSVRQMPAELEQADYVVSTLPQTSLSDNLLDDAALKKMPTHGVLVNVGRSNVLDTTALVAALRSDRLAGAVLDVFDQEPLPADSDLWTVPGLTITAHVSAISHPVLVVPLFLKNLTRYRAGEALSYQVDFDNGY
ncbi:MAG: D-2-hydroxyacid dehydrogenase [Pseudomonadota bacterium]